MTLLVIVMKTQQNKKEKIFLVDIVILETKNNVFGNIKFKENQESIILQIILNYIKILNHTKRSFKSRKNTFTSTGGLQYSIEGFNGLNPAKNRSSERQTLSLSSRNKILIRLQIIHLPIVIQLMRYIKGKGETNIWQNVQLFHI